MLVVFQGQAPIFPEDAKDNRDPSWLTHRCCLRRASEMRPRKSVMNSISLKSVEIVTVHGAVSVVAYVEEGQAATKETRRTCARSVASLVAEFDFQPSDNIFNSYVLTIDTGLPENNGYAVDFIEAAAEVAAQETLKKSFCRM